MCAMPGTHSKWACVEHGRIVDFMTFMTGEMWNVLLQHSILGRLAARRRSRSRDRLRARRGARPGLRAISRTTSSARARWRWWAKLAGDEVADWLSGVMIGREIRNARTWAHRHGYDGARVRLIGEDALVARYAPALRAEPTSRSSARRPHAPPRAACGASPCRPESSYSIRIAAHCS